MLGTKRLTFFPARTKVQPATIDKTSVLPTGTKSAQNEALALFRILSMLISASLTFSPFAAISIKGPRGQP